LARRHIRSRGVSLSCRPGAVESEIGGRLSFLERECKVGYRWGQVGADQETIDSMEFIARVTSHIPDKGQVKDSLAAHESKMLEAEGRAKYD